MPRMLAYWLGKAGEDCEMPWQNEVRTIDKKSLSMSYNWASGTIDHNDKNSINLPQIQVTIPIWMLKRKLMCYMGV